MQRLFSAYARLLPSPAPKALLRTFCSSGRVTEMRRFRYPVSQWIGWQTSVRAKAAMRAGTLARLSSQRVSNSCWNAESSDALFVPLFVIHWMFSELLFSAVSDQL